MFTPFAKREAAAEAERQARPPGASGTDEIDDLKRQMEEMQKRLDRLGNKDLGNKD
jgi:polyhydroxyalkanoate synthesis regulator protein